MIGIDTLSWAKLAYLFSTDKEKFVRTMLGLGDYFITHEVLAELRHHLPDYAELYEPIAILPSLKMKTAGYLETGFDVADASLLEYADLRKCLVITEDQQMLELGRASKQKTIQLADFIKYFYTRNFITHREFYQIIKILRRLKNITIKKEKLLLRKLQE